jgi:hypothetical protein
MKVVRLVLLARGTRPHKILDDGAEVGGVEVAA